MRNADYVKSYLSRGMTLIEILVVLTLIGIVMGIVGGNYLAPPRANRTARFHAPVVAAP